jgi:hypothetical protein
MMVRMILGFCGALQCMQCIRKGSFYMYGPAATVAGHVARTCPPQLAAERREAVWMINVTFEPRLTLVGRTKWRRFYRCGFNLAQALEQKRRRCPNGSRMSYKVERPKAHLFHHGYCGSKRKHRRIIVYG